MIQYWYNQYNGVVCMKRLVFLLVSLITCCTFLIGATACSCKAEDKTNNETQDVEGNDTEEETPDDEGETPLVTSSITYQAAPISGIDEAVFNAIKKKLGNYPESYEEGVGVTVDGLRSDVLDEAYLYTFIGWYYDADCLQACENGVIGTDKTGDIILYAKVQKTPRSDLDKEHWGS